MGMAATVKHRSPGRLRLKFAAGTEQDDIRRIVDHFRAGGELQAVEGNLLTKTLLIKARDDRKLQAVLRKADEEGLFDIKEGAEKSGASMTLTDLRHAIDRFFREISDNRLDFRSGMAVVMVGLGLRQLLVGKFMPAGLTLVFYALGLLEIKKVERKQ